MPAIRAEDEGDVRRLVLCRPDEFNTITLELRNELDAMIRERHYSPEYAVSRALRRYAKVFQSIESSYLAERASSLSYRVTITVEGDGTWRYEATTMLRMSERPEPLAHTDSNTLHRIA